jgi:ribonuclease-3
MNPLEHLINISTEIESKLGYTFKDKNLLALAFVHRSFINENRFLTEKHNERLEFLGDSILGLLVSEYLYRYLPGTPEGELSHLRSRLVEATSCYDYVKQLDVEKYILLGKGEKLSGGRGRDSILADLFEAIIGAIYLDGGLDSARKFIFKNFSKDIDSILKTPVSNWKAVLQDYSQKKHQKAPVYTIISEAGPDHSKTFVISVSINDEEVARGEGTSKKEAQQNAARNAVERLIPDPLSSYGES